MIEERDRRVSVLHDLIREAGLEAGEHPVAEQLFAYQERLLTGEEEAEVQDHLSLCPGCTRMVLELSGDVEPEVPEAETAPSVERIAKLWLGMRGRLLLPFPAAMPPRRRSFERIASAVAASLLLATVGASLWAWTLRQQNLLLGEPRVNVEVRDLIPLSEGETRRDEEGKSPLPREAKAVLLVLNSADLRPFPIYRAEILETSTGKILWASDQLRRTARGSFALELPRPFPGSGKYRIRLFGVDGGKRDPLAEYEVNLSEAK
jgi:hypothetical protein